MKQIILTLFLSLLLFCPDISKANDLNDVIINDCSIGNDTIWAATSNGVFEISVFSGMFRQHIPDQSIYEIAATSSGSVAAVSDDGIMVYDGYDWEAHTLPNTTIRATNIHIKPNDDIIFIHDTSLYQIRNNMVAPYAVPDSLDIHGIYESETSDDIWCFTFVGNIGYLSRLRNDMWESYDAMLSNWREFITITDVDETTSYVNYVWEWRLEPDHVVYFVDQNGASLYASRGWSWDSSSWIQDDGTFWCFQPYGSGLDRALSRFTGESWEPIPSVAYGYTNSLSQASHIYTLDMFDDDQGVMYFLLRPWMSTDTPNQPILSRYDSESWHIYTPEDGAPENITGIIGTDSSNTIWFTTSSGIAKLVDEAWTTYSIFDPIVEANITEHGLLLHTDSYICLIDDDIQFYYLTPELLSVENDHQPESFAILANYPNPFNPSTTITITIQQQDIYTLCIYNAIGQKVTTLLNGPIDPGIYTIAFNGNNLGNGIYYAVLSSPNTRITVKMILLK